MLKQTFGLSFRQIGLITLVSQITTHCCSPSSVSTPTGGRSRNRSRWVWPSRWSEWCCSVSARLFRRPRRGGAHRPRLCRLSSSRLGLPGSRRVGAGFAQAFFQVGGNVGSAVGPLLAAFLVLPYGQRAIAWFSLAALVGILFLWNVGNWYKRTGVFNPSATAAPVARTSLSPGRLARRLRCSSGSSFPVHLPGRLGSYLHLLPDEPSSTCLCAARRFTCFSFWVPWRREQSSEGPSAIGLEDAASSCGRFWACSLRARASLRRPPLDSRAFGDHWTDPRLGVLRDHRLCPGAGPRRSGMTGVVLSGSPSAPPASARPWSGELADRQHCYGLPRVLRVCRR